MEIKLLPDGVPASFEVVCAQDPYRQLHQPAVRLSQRLTSCTR